MDEFFTTVQYSIGETVCGEVVVVSAWSKVRLAARSKLARYGPSFIIY